MAEITAMKLDDQDRAKSTGFGLVAPLFGSAYGLFCLCCVRRTKGGLPMSDEDAFWHSIPIFGLALFFHACYFGYYRRHPWLRWSLMLLAILVMASGLAVYFGPGIRRLL